MLLGYHVLRPFEVVIPHIIPLVFGIVYSHCLQGLSKHIHILPYTKTSRLKHCLSPAPCHLYLF